MPAPPGTPLMTSSTSRDGRARVGFLRPRSLRARLALFLGATIAVVIGAATYLQSRLVESTLDAELADTARLSAWAAADEIELRENAADPDAVRQRLLEFIETVPEVGSISLVTLDGTRPVLFASTASAAHPDVIDVGRRAIQERQVQWGDRADPLRIVAVPLTRGDRVTAAVAVTVSFDSLHRLRERGRVIAVWATLVSVLVLFTAVEFLARWLIHRPIDAIRQTMRLVASGDLSARAAVLGDDEIGAVASGLNHMLGEMEDLQGGLRQRVAEATREVGARNRELLDMYQQMFQLREALGRSQQLAAVGETAAAVAHEIGTPLNLVSGHLQLAVEELGPGSPAARRLQVAEGQLRKVTATVQDLLARSRSRTRREAVDLPAVLRRLTALGQPALESARIKLSYEGVPLPPLQADATQVEVALLNLVSNAIDAMPAGGELAIRLNVSNGAAVIDVTDTGTGIQPEIVERVFDPWVTTKDAGRGTGLGLSVAYGIIEEHGGWFDVHSAPDQGTRFSVFLPVRPEPVGGETNS